MGKNGWEDNVVQVKVGIIYWVCTAIIFLSIEWRPIL